MILLDHDAIVRRLLTTPATIDGLAAELGIGKQAIARIYHSHTTPERREQARRLKAYVLRDSGASRARADADKIVARLLADATVHGISREYRVSDTLICSLYSERTTYTQREAARLRKLAEREGVRAGQFRPGNKPWSTGRKGIHLSPATEFKKGALRGAAARHWRPVGTVVERLDKDGHRRRYVKVRDDGPPQRRWLTVARKRWLDERGEIPAGHRIMHANGDTLDDDVDNLVCVTGGEAMELQGRLNPQMARRRAAGASRAATARWAAQRLVKAAKAEREPPGSLVTWRRCVACDHETEQSPLRCPKCHGGAWEQFQRPPTRQTTGMQAFMEELRSVG